MEKKLLVYPTVEAIEVTIRNLSSWKQEDFEPNFNIYLGLMAGGYVIKPKEGKWFFIRELDSKYEIIEEMVEPIQETAYIWTLSYRPFIMGGNVNQPMCTIVPVLERKNIEGFDFFSFQTPKGTIKICEAQTGAIIASSFEEVFENIEGVPKEVLQGQIDLGKHLAETADKKTNEEFFKSYRY